MLGLKIRHKVKQSKTKSYAINICAESQNFTAELSAKGKISSCKQKSVMSSFQWKGATWHVYIVTVGPDLGRTVVPCPFLLQTGHCQVMLLRNLPFVCLCCPSPLNKQTVGFLSFSKANFTDK